MMRRWIISSVIGAFALGAAAGSAAVAQTPPPSSSGAFDKLSPGNQKIATALYKAQTTSTTATTTPLTLDEIAAKKQSGQGWGRVFKDMKTQGLVQEKNLGQVISKNNHSTKAAVTTASGRQVNTSSSSWKGQGSDEGSHNSGHSSGSGGGAAHGGGKGGK